MTNAQTRFNEVYISTTEIIQTLNISRTAISNARKEGKLNDPIVLSNGLVVLYERKAVEHIVEEWKNKLEARRNA